MHLKICWLYYDLMNTYGDRGNILTLKYRLEKRQIKYEIDLFSINSSYKKILSADLFLMGGAEDRQQRIVSEDLTEDKEKAFRERLARCTPGLYICGAYQFLGRYYETANQERLRCLNIAPLYTKNPNPKQKRLIGDIVVKVTHPELLSSPHFKDNNRYLIGFENHGGHTYLEDSKLSLGTIIKGYGNNNSDYLEGFLYQNTIGTYLHGPILPRNPALADYLIEKALYIKYNQEVGLKKLDDNLETANRLYLLKQFNVKI